MPKIITVWHNFAKLLYQYEFFMPHSVCDHDITDRQTTCRSNTALCVGSRGKMLLINFCRFVYAARQLHETIASVSSDLE